jgi:hypothetical protein
MIENNYSSDDDHVPFDLPFDNMVPFQALYYYYLFIYYSFYIFSDKQEKSSQLELNENI